MLSFRKKYGGRDIENIMRRVVMCYMIRIKRMSGEYFLRIRLRIF